MNKAFTFLLLCAVFLSACGFGGRPSPGAFETQAARIATEIPTDEPTAVPFTPTVTASPAPPSATPNLTPQPTATSVLFPMLTFAKDTICRIGPGKRYFARLSVSKGKSYEASGRNEDGTWVSVQAPQAGDQCWTPVDSLESAGDLSALRVLETQPLPETPINVVASGNACGVINHLWLYWYGIDALGYRIYRNGKEIATVYGSKFRDLETPRSKTPTNFYYEIEAFNASGVSERTGVTVTICG